MLIRIQEHVINHHALCRQTWFSYVIIPILSRELSFFQAKVWTLLRLPSLRDRLLRSNRVALMEYLMTTTLPTCRMMAFVYLPASLLVGKRLCAASSKGSCQLLKAASRYGKDLQSRAMTVVAAHRKIQRLTGSCIGSAKASFRSILYDTAKKP